MHVWVKEIKHDRNINNFKKQEKSTKIYSDKIQTPLGIIKYNTLGDSEINISHLVKERS
jgi:hypothetical protein